MVKPLFKLTEVFIYQLIFVDVRRKILASVEVVFSKRGVNFREFW
jgi:hypothetical protein